MLTSALLESVSISKSSSTCGQPAGRNRGCPGGVPSCGQQQGRTAHNPAVPVVSNRLFSHRWHDQNCKFVPVVPVGKFSFIMINSYTLLGRPLPPGSHLCGTHTKKNVTGHLLTWRPLPRFLGPPCGSGITFRQLTHDAIFPGRSVYKTLLLTVFCK